MAKHPHLILIQSLCLSVLFCFLSLAISFAANTPSPTQPGGPGSPSHSQENTQDPANSKGGEAAAIASVAKLAVDMNNETVKRIESFYSNTVQNFVFHITVVATLVGLLGIASVVLMAERTAKRQSKKALGPVRQWQREHGELYASLQTERQGYEELRSAFTVFQADAFKNMQDILAELKNGRVEYEMLRSDFRAFQVDAIGNMRGLHMVTLAWLVRA